MRGLARNRRRLLKVRLQCQRRRTPWHYGGQDHMGIAELLRAVLPWMLILLLMACSAEKPPGDATTLTSNPSMPGSKAAERDSSAAGESPPIAKSDTNTATDAKQPLEQDERYRQRIVGTWEDDYQGQRTMTLNEDGTGIMVVELSGWKAALFAQRLEFQMRWRLEDGYLRKETVDGKPEQAVKAILKMMGKEVKEPILELSEDRLLLLDQDGETKYDWRRTNPAAKPNSSR